MSSWWSSVHRSSANRSMFITCIDPFLNLLIAINRLFPNLFDVDLICCHYHFQRRTSFWRFYQKILNFFHINLNHHYCGLKCDIRISICRYPFENFLWRHRDYTWIASLSILSFFTKERIRFTRASLSICESCDIQTFPGFSSIPTPNFSQTLS